MPPATDPASTSPSPTSPSLPEGVARALLPDPAPVLGGRALRPFTAWHAILLRRIGSPVLDIIDGRPVLGGDYDAYATAAFILSLPDDLLTQLWEQGQLPRARDQWLRTLEDPVILVSLAEHVASHILAPFSAYLPFKSTGGDDGKKKAPPSAGSSPSAATSPAPTTSPSSGHSTSPSPTFSPPTPSSANPAASPPPPPPKPSSSSSPT